MTMAAEGRGSFSRSRRRRGQSLIEFALLMPILLTLITTLVGVEQAISIAIVSQKYTRMWLNHLMFNHRYYLEERYCKRVRSGRYSSRTWIGMDDNINYEVDNPVAKAPTVRIGTGKPPGGDDEPRNPSARQNVRIRVTAFTCLPQRGVKYGEPYSEGFMGANTFARPSYPFCDRSIEGE